MINYGKLNSVNIMMHYMDINIKKPCKTIASPAELFHFPYGNTD